MGGDLGVYLEVVHSYLPHYNAVGHIALVRYDF